MSKEVIEKVVYTPNKGSQVAALISPYEEILYYGTRANGKTNCQIMKFLSLVGMGYKKYWKGIILDQTAKSLSDVISQTEAMIDLLQMKGVKIRRSSPTTFTFPQGETLTFEFGRTMQDYANKLHGKEFPFIGFNELSSRPTDEFYTAAMSMRRETFIPELHPLPDGSLLPRIPVVTFSTTNPWGVGIDWVSRRFKLETQPVGIPFSKVTKIPCKESEGGVKEISLRTVSYFGNWSENPHITPEYIAWLKSLKETDPPLYKAWALGELGVNIGSMFGKVFSKDKHVIPSFNIPSSWRVDRTHDWGQSSPFANLWWAQANGEEAKFPDGTTFCPPKGSLICIGEYFGGQRNAPEKGVDLSASKVAKCVAWIDRQLNSNYELEDLPKELRNAGDEIGIINIKTNIISTKVKAGAADYSINNGETTSGRSIADVMKEQGVEWTNCNKSNGARVGGAALIREHLENTMQSIPDLPHIYFMDHCEGIIERLPRITRCSKDPDDVDTTANDHDYDALRYRVMEGEIKTLKSVIPRKNPQLNAFLSYL